jgi:exopolysaccharide production protein ExoQ
MTPLLATLVYACGIAGLFYLDRDNFVRTSKALWLPVLYLWVLGSRPVSFWLGVSPPSGTNTQLDGSPVDGAFFLALLIVAICVLFRRGRRTLTFLKTNKMILIYFLFCLVSIIWSDFPGVAIKRWVKAIGDLAMILIVLTDERPIAALRRVFSRVGFVLMPLSLLFIKYYPYLGRSYDSWTGFQTNTGLTSDKNMLGVITFVLSLGALWRVLDLLWSDDTPTHRGRHLLAQGTLLAFGISLLISANSVTSLVSFVLGAGLMLTTRLQFMQRKPAAVHILVLLLVVSASALILFGGRASVASALGRNANLARMDIWEAIIPMAPNALIGAGFESFWLGTRVERLAQLFPNLGLNEAHDGYIEVYLELGWVGLSLIALLWIDAYRRAVKAFRLEPAIGGLLLAYILTAVTYNVTEAGFRMLDPLWIFFLLAVVESSSIVSGVRVGAATRLDSSLGRMPGLALRNGPAIRPDRRDMARKIVQRRTA